MQGMTAQFSPTFSSTPKTVNHAVGAATVHGQPSETQVAAVASIACLKCGEKGHSAKECKSDVQCDVYRKGHASDRCSWLKQKKPVATFVGFGAPGLGCFVADFAKDSGTEVKGKAIAIIGIKEGGEGTVDAEMLEMCLGRTYPWKWDWHAKQLAGGAFLVSFPSVSRINEVALYEWVPLRGANIMVNVKQWSDECMAAGKLSTIWIRAKGVPRSMKNWHGLCQVGSTVGQVIEVDMKQLKVSGQVRIKVGVVDIDKVPQMTKLTSPKLTIHYIYIQIQEIVEEGWMRAEEDMNLDFEDMEDNVSQELEGSKSKKQKNDVGEVTDASLGSTIQASSRTVKALEDRERAIRAQDDIDDRTFGGSKNTKKNSDEVVGNKEQAIPIEHVGQEEGMGSQTEVQTGMELDGGKKDEHDDEKVDLSCSDGEEVEGMDAIGSQSSGVSFATQLENIKDGKPRFTKKNMSLPLETGDGTDTRFSNRLASQNMDDVPVMERAKARAAAKNDISSEGTLPTVLNSDSSVLVDVASLVGIDLGNSLDMIEDNLNLIRSHEQARFNLFNLSKTSLRNDETQDHAAAVSQIASVDTILQDLLSLTNDELDDSDNEDADLFQLLEANKAATTVKKLPIVCLNEPPVKIDFVVKGKGKKKNNLKC
ncbi:hypothetical protein ACQ4PT_043334 [Festuca glaucescens]